MQIFRQERIQQDKTDCGPFCLAFLVNHYGRSVSINYLRDVCGSSSTGVSLLRLGKAAEKLGFETRALKADAELLHSRIDAPFIAFIDGGHFVVVKKHKYNNLYLYDPAIGDTHLTIAQFEQRWRGNNEFGIILECIPRKHFNEIEFPKEEQTSLLPTLIDYVKPHRRMLFKVILCLALGSLIQLILPVLTKNVVDIGIEGQDLHALIIILAGQTMLVIASVISGFIESRIILYIGSRINAHLVYDLFNKLVRLPISFFGTRQSGDILQRVADQGRIENFITNTLLESLSVVFNFIIFCYLLIQYSWSIFLLVFAGQIIYVIWTISFLNQRRRLDYEAFSKITASQDSVIEIVRGMQEIKLNSCYRNKITKWLATQKELYYTRIKNIKMTQLQESGTTFIGELLNVTVLFVSAISVMHGNLSFGTMLAIQAIVGQLSGSIQRALGVVNDIQDTTIATERLEHVSNHTTENSNESQIISVGEKGCQIDIRNLSFAYPGTENFALKNINLSFPENGVIAIVGASGSGKTTLLKLLLGFYKPTTGSIHIKGLPLTDINLDAWRKDCGIVMQDGYIFSGTISENISPSDETINEKRLWETAKIAKIDEYIQSLPQGINTKIGMNGKELSGGQKQRILIARAIYKNPKILLFDEATNSLDAENELEIWQRMAEIFREKTSIIIAHRLSTIKFADCIIVLDKGELVEQGTHKELMEKKGKYYAMINAQLQT